MVYDIEMNTKLICWQVSLVKDRNLIEKQDEDQENLREMNGDIRHKEVLDEKSMKEEDENPDRKRIIAS